MTEGISEEPYQNFSKRVWDKSVEKRRPLRALFEITYRCNIHCVHCYTDPYNTPEHLRREMGFEEILKTLDDLKEAGTFWLTLSGGEAFVHPKFRQIYEEAKKRAFVVSLFTNGTMVTESLADFLAEDPPFVIEVSLHAATANTFEKITQVSGSFSPFEKGIARLLARNLPVKIKTKAMTGNLHELKQIKEYVANLGLEFNMQSTLYPRLNGDLTATEYRVKPDEVVELEYGEEEESCASHETAEEASPADERLFRCGCGTNSVTISPYGFLRACTFTTWPSYNLKEIPLPEAFQQLCVEIQKARYEGKSPCKSCPVHVYCDKNPVSALHEVGSMQAPVPYFCDVAYGRAAKEKGNGS